MLIINRHVQEIEIAYKQLARQIKFEVTLTDPMLFCCLVLSAMKLQASTHCLISGAAWAKLLYRLAVLLTSILFTSGTETLTVRQQYATALRKADIRKSCLTTCNASAIHKWAAIMRDMNKGGKQHLNYYSLGMFDNVFKNQIRV